MLLENKYFFFKIEFEPMRDRDRELWSVGAGTFLSHSECLVGGIHSVSVQKLDALIYTEGKKSLAVRWRDVFQSIHMWCCFPSCAAVRLVAGRGEIRNFEYKHLGSYLNNNNQPLLQVTTKNCELVCTFLVWNLDISHFKTINCKLQFCSFKMNAGHGKMCPKEFS